MKIRSLLLFLFMSFQLFAQGESYGMIYNSMYYTASDNTFHFESYFAYGNGLITMTSTTQTVVGNTLYVRGYYNTCGFWPQTGGGDVHTVSYPIPANVTTVIMSTNIIHCQSGSPVTAEDVYTYSFNPTLSTIGFDSEKPLWFPNPVQELLHLNESAEPATAFQVYTLQGQLVQSATGATSAIDCATLPKGIYLLRFEQNGVWKTEKICKE
ncbi:MAG: Secretion system C-terminal sorting domain [Bacteroidota bacterium]|jgi:hypothetical protein